ncbi:hypothetical protein SDC9_89650 [bioreactor metagenome]|uniref:Uncharacterized protein n=1 Tax=bioreactor metagenome TaxID=1076179 RepID=A0A644ZRG9_9ZZZZ
MKDKHKVLKVVIMNPEEVDVEKIKEEFTKNVLKAYNQKRNKEISRLKGLL